MLLSILFGLVESIRIPAEPWFLSAGLLVRLRPEFAHAYPRVPGGLWLPAHRREGDVGVLWLDSNPDPASGDSPPLVADHLEILERDSPGAPGGD